MKRFYIWYWDQADAGFAVLYDVFCVVVLVAVSPLLLGVAALSVPVAAIGAVVNFLTSKGRK